MAKTDFKSVDEYIAAQPEAVQGVLERARSVIHKALPRAEEVISYNMPTFKVNGRAVLHIAGWRQHYSLYLASERVVAAFKKELAPYEIQKGTVRFPISKPVPAKLIERIARFRAKEVAEREKAAPKKRGASTKVR